MLRLLLATVVALLVIAGTAAAAGTPLHGTFQTVIAKAPQPQLVGIWRITLLPSSHYTIKRNDDVLIRGRDTQTKTTISFGHETGPAACTGSEASATYKWSLHAGSVLYLTAVRDSCPGRHLVLTKNPLLKTG